MLIILNNSTLGKNSWNFPRLVLFKILENISISNEKLKWPYIKSLYLTLAVAAFKGLSICWTSISNKKSSPFSNDSLSTSLIANNLPVAGSIEKNPSSFPAIKRKIILLHVNFI